MSWRAISADCTASRSRPPPRPMPWSFGSCGRGTGKRRGVGASRSRRASRFRSMASCGISSAHCPCANSPCASARSIWPCWRAGIIRVGGTANGYPSRPSRACRTASWCTLFRAWHGAICRRTVVKSHNTFPSWWYLTYHIGMKSLIASVSLILGLLPIGAICRRAVVKSHNTFPSWWYLTYHIGMKSLIASVSLILGLLPIGLGIGAAQAQQAPTTVKKVPVHPTTSVAGKDLYREYCAVCHGTTGKGDGPAASALKVPPSDLTQISKKNGGKFPELQVQHIINGEADE